MSKFADPAFIGHQAMGRVWGRMALAIATSPILPYSPSEYAVWLSGAYESFKTAHESALNSQGISLCKEGESKREIVMFAHRSVGD